jgi:hypothetical protein
MGATYAVLEINAHHSFGSRLVQLAGNQQQWRNAAPTCSFGSIFCSEGAPPLPQPCSPHLVGQLLHPLGDGGVHSCRHQRWRTSACRRQPEGVKRCISMDTESQLLVSCRFRADARRSSSRMSQISPSWSSLKLKSSGSPPQ